MDGSMHGLIVLERMPQQMDLRVQEDERTGVTNPTVRRRLQSRLYQRARSESLSSEEISDICLAIDAIMGQGSVKQ